MLKGLAMGVIVVALTAFVLYRALAPFRRIWGAMRWQPFTCRRRDVPPPYRNQSGEVAAWRRRRARKRAGQPPTDHLVEILELPDDQGGQPRLLAECSEIDCDWSADVDSGLGNTDAEDELRSKARKHTDNIAENIRRCHDGVTATAPRP